MELDLYYVREKVLSMTHTVTHGQPDDQYISELNEGQWEERNIEIVLRYTKRK
jgi:hypothetical protein